ncbi:hypothetical protein HDF09_002096 [Edaphobacter lichenicola]|uniref:Uncharacterized protein n=1 Tax=Tunturiibacter empetritectus TaxID=3069691 RepID=A0A7W8MRL1_9BACT|nr:hypothetical protein [Edaphobacter lichenicola]
MKQLDAEALMAAHRQALESLLLREAILMAL